MSHKGFTERSQRHNGLPVHEVSDVAHEHGTSAIMRRIEGLFERNINPDGSLKNISNDTTRNYR